MNPAGSLQRGVALMPATISRFFGLAVLAAALSLPQSGRAKEYVDLELVIATDVSQSIDREEALLQRQGVADAFRSAEVVNAIASGVLRKIAVAYIDYSSRAFNRVVIDWQIVSDAKSAAAFADRLLGSDLTFGRRTSISDALELGAEMIRTNDIEGTRTVIDVSGDGPNNYGRFVDDVRDAVMAQRITINGLPIINDHGGPGSRYNLDDLDQYYRGCVIGGPGAFLVVARSFEDFARAIRKKLVLEIAGMMPEERPFLMRAAVAPSARVRPGPDGFTYARGCDIGERLRDSYWSDP